MRPRDAAARVLRAIFSLRGPSPRANARRLRARGEDAAAFVLRDMAEADVPAVSRIHAVTWAQTYPLVRRPPTAALRERQWREKLARPEPGWFALVVQKPGGEIVGFVQGSRYANPDQPDYGGELGKIYLLRDYQRLGLGRRMMGEAARRFLADGVSSMLLFAAAENPSVAFYERLGGERLREPDGSLSPGNFGWRDLRRLADACAG